MFSREAAIRLRESIASAEPDIGLIDEYCNHYGLGFDTPDRPVTHQFHAFTSDQFTIVLQRFSLPVELQRGTAFILHGYFDHVGLFGKLIDHCLQRGYAVVIADLPGHGLSSGPQASIDSFSRYCRVFAETLQVSEHGGAHRPWIGIGQSTGAAVLMDALLHHDIARRFEFSRLVLLAPLLRTHSWWRTRLSFSILRWFLPRLKRNFSLNSHDGEFQEFLKHNDALQSRVIPGPWVAAMMDFEKRFRRAAPCGLSVDIIQGTGDRTVDWQYNLPQIEHRFPGSSSYLIADARHHLVNESQEYRDRVFALLDEILERD